jgi:hypothetical protein
MLVVCKAKLSFSSDEPTVLTPFLELFSYINSKKEQFLAGGQKVRIEEGKVVPEGYLDPVKTIDQVLFCVYMISLSMFKNFAQEAHLREFVLRRLNAFRQVSGSFEITEQNWEKSYLLRPS